MYYSLYYSTLLFFILLFFFFFFNDPAPTEIYTLSLHDALPIFTDHPDTLVELTLESDTFLKTEERKLLYQSHEGIVHLIPKIKRLESANSEYREVNLNQNIKELFQDYFKTKNNNQQLNQEMMDLFDEVLKE